MCGHVFGRFGWHTQVCNPQKPVIWRGIHYLAFYPYLGYFVHTCVQAVVHGMAPCKTCCRLSATPFFLCYRNDHWFTDFCLQGLVQLFALISIWMCLHVNTSMCMHAGVHVLIIYMLTSAHMHHRPHCHAHIPHVWASSRDALIAPLHGIQVPCPWSCAYCMRSTGRIHLVSLPTEWINTSSVLFDPFALRKSRFNIPVSTAKRKRCHRFFLE